MKIKEQLEMIIDKQGERTLALIDENPMYAESMIDQYCNLIKAYVSIAEKMPPKSKFNLDGKLLEIDE